MCPRVRKKLLRWLCVWGQIRTELVVLVSQQKELKSRTENNCDQTPGPQSPWPFTADPGSSVSQLLICFVLITVQGDAFIRADRYIASFLFGSGQYVAT